MTGFFQFDDMMGADEAEEIRATAERLGPWAPGKVLNPEGVHTVDHNFRHCDEVFPGNVDTLAAMDARLQALFNGALQRAGLAADGLEPIRVVRYPEHKGFFPHRDSLTAYPGQIRLFGVLVYLNHPGNGGYTEFYRPVHYQFLPQPGRVILFPVSHDHLHESVPATQKKYVAVSWFYRKISD